MPRHPVQYIACRCLPALVSSARSRCATTPTRCSGLLEQVTPLLRRLERTRFGSLAGRGSVADHDRIIARCAEGRADDAARAAHENWSTLGRLLHLDDEADSITTRSPEGAPWPSPTSPATG